MYQQMLPGFFVITHPFLKQYIDHLHTPEAFGFRVNEIKM